MKRIVGIGEKMLNNLDTNELMMILVDKYKKYTVNDHSSITVEKAQQLMNSILYCINGYLKSLDKGLVSASEHYNALVLYERGLEHEKTNLSNAKKLLSYMKNNILNIDNVYYQDTILKGIDLFFRNYDVLYAAHETPGSIDYPLALPIYDLEGVEYILEYLNRLYIENNFCACFETDNIECLLKKFNDDYKDLPFNIFELVVRNAIGLEILGTDIMKLNITTYERACLYEILKPLSLEQIQEKITLAINKVLQFHKIEDNKQKAYTTKVVIELSYEIKQALSIKRLENTFI
jgi:hypothetical protein